MKKGNSVVSIVLFLSTFIMLVSCGGQKAEWKGTIEEEDGVTVIKNPKEPMYDESVFVLEDDLTIRGDEEKEEQMFQDIRTFDVNDNGDIYILDEKAANIKVFDSNGRHLRTIGKKGPGPGEFEMPISIAITPRKEIIINDMGKRALAFFDLEGHYIRQLSIADKFLFFGPRVTSQGHLIASHMVPAETPTSELKIFDSGLNLITALTSIPGDKPPVINFFTARTMSSLLWSMNYQDEIIWGNFLGGDYELNIHDREGRLVRKIIRDYDPRALTAGDKERMMDETFGDSPARNQWQVRFPSNYPPFSGFTCDDEGRVYVKTYEKVKEEEGSYFDIFDPEGRYIAKILFEVNPMILERGYLYTIEEDEEGYQIFKRYKVTWKY